MLDGRFDVVGAWDGEFVDGAAVGLRDGSPHGIKSVEYNPSTFTADDLLFTKSRRLLTDTASLFFFFPFRDDFGVDPPRRFFN